MRNLTLLLKIVNFEANNFLIFYKPFSMVFQ